MTYLLVSILLLQIQPILLEIGNFCEWHGFIPCRLVWDRQLYRRKSSSTKPDITLYLDIGRVWHNYGFLSIYLASASCYRIDWAILIFNLLHRVKNWCKTCRLPSWYLSQKTFFSWAEDGEVDKNTVRHVFATPVNVLYKNLSISMNTYVISWYQSLEEKSHSSGHHDIGTLFAVGGIW